MQLRKKKLAKIEVFRHFAIPTQTLRDTGAALLLMEPSSKPSGSWSLLIRLVIYPGSGR